MFTAYLIDILSFLRLISHLLSGGFPNHAHPGAEWTMPLMSSQRCLPDAGMVSVTVQSPHTYPPSAM